MDSKINFYSDLALLKFPFISFCFIVGNSFTILLIKLLLFTYSSPLQVKTVLFLRPNTQQKYHEKTLDYVRNSEGVINASFFANCKGLLQKAEIKKIKYQFSKTYTQQLPDAIVSYVSQNFVDKFKNTMKNEKNIDVWPVSHESKKNNKKFLYPLLLALTLVLFGSFSAHIVHKSNKEIKNKVQILKLFGFSENKIWRGVLRLRVLDVFSFWFLGGALFYFLQKNLPASISPNISIYRPLIISGMFGAIAFFYLTKATFKDIIFQYLFEKRF